MTAENYIETLFRRNYPAMLALAVRLLHDRETARDIVHDVFASLMTQAPSQATTAFLLGGVRFACLNHIRNLSVRERLNRLYALDLCEIEDDAWPDDEDVARLNAIVDSRLSDQCRRVVRLRFSGRLSYGDIAAELGISEVAVYKHLRHALNVLRENFIRNER